MVPTIPNDALSHEDKMKEKGAYPPEVYRELLEHRKTLIP